MRGMENLIINKLVKLLKHQESARAIGSIAEAEAFAGRIQELLTKHKLEMSDIQFVEQEQAEPIEQQHVTPEDLGIARERRRIEWQEDLATAVAYSNDCQTLISNRSNAAFFVGRKSDREICVALHRYFLTLIVEMSEKAAEQAKDNERGKCKARLGSYYTGADFRWHMRNFRVSFCAGMSTAIQQRLYERRRVLEAAAKQESETSTALIHLRKTSEAINAYLEDLFKDRKPRKAKDNIAETRHVSDAYQAGEQAGRKVALTAGALK